MLLNAKPAWTATDSFRNAMFNAEVVKYDHNGTITQHPRKIYLNRAWYNKLAQETDGKTIIGRNRNGFCHLTVCLAEGIEIPIYMVMDDQDHAEFLI